MVLDIHSAKLTAVPGASGWVQVHEFTPSDEEKLNKRGKMFVVVASKQGAEGVESITTGREIISRIYEEYLGDMQKDAFTALSDAVRKINLEFAQVLGLELAACVYLGEALYVAAVGGVQAHLCRNAGVSKLVESGEDPVSISGFPQDGDELILATKSFWNLFSPQTVKENVGKIDVETSLEYFAPRMRANETPSTTGLLLIKFGGDKGLFVGEEKEDVAEEPVKTKTSAVNIFSEIIKKLPQKNIFVKKQSLEQSTPQAKKTTMTAGVVLLILLVISVFFGLHQKKIKDLEKTYGETLNKAISLYNESIGIYEIEKPRSRELLIEADSLLNEVAESDYKDARIAEYLEKIMEARGRVLGEYETNVSEFLDLTLQTSGFNGSSIASSGEEMFVFDKEKKRIIQVNIADKKAEIYQTEDFPDGIFEISSYEDRVFGASNDGIYEGGASQRAIDASVNSGIFYAYAGNIYLLGRDENTITRYPGIEGGFSEGSDWLAPGIEADFSKVVDMTIDGAIWLLSSTGKVSKFTQGSPQSVDLSVMPEKLITPTSIYTNENLQYVYVLEKDHGRVVILDKTGDYVGQYKNDSIKDAKDIVVSEEEGKIILMTGSKLLQIEIKHLN